MLCFVLAVCFLFYTIVSIDTQCNMLVGGLFTGPFKNSDMAEWFTAGYFTMSLLIRSGSDGDFTTLGPTTKTSYWSSTVLYCSSFAHNNLYVIIMSLVS